MADLAKLVVRLEAQSAQLLSELEKANSKIDRFSRQTSRTLNNWAAGIAGAFSAKALVDYSAGVIKAEGDLVSMAQAAGTSVETLSSLGYAASQSGSNLDELNQALRGISNSAEEAAKGSGAAADAYEALGIKVINANGGLKSTDQLLLELADKFSKYQDGAAKSALAQDILGKSGRALIQFMNEGSKGITELTDEAKKLGLAVGTDAAKNADKLVDSFERLAAVGRAATGKFLETLVPILERYVSNAAEATAANAKFEDSTRTLAAGLKILFTAGTIIAEVFNRIGNALGAAAAVFIAVLQKDYRRAVQIVIDANRDHVKSVSDTAKKVADIWDDDLQEVVVTAKKVDAQLKETLVLGGKNAGLSEVTVAVKPLELSGIEKYYDQLNQLTQTQQEKALTSYYEQKVALDELLSAGKIGAAEYADRMKEVSAALDDATGATKRQADALDRAQKVAAEGKQVWEETRTPLEKYNMELTKLQLLLSQGAIDDDTYDRAAIQAKKSLDQTSADVEDFFRRARENAQDILGDGIVDVIDQGFKKGGLSALNTFGQMLEKLAAQALAAQIWKYIFGTEGTGGSSTAGLLGGLVSSLLGSAVTSGGTASSGGSGGFGGSRDSGGRGRAGVSYLIGTKAQPERFVPDQPGTFYPADQMLAGGGDSVQPALNVNIQNFGTSKGFEVQQLSANDVRIIARDEVSQHSPRVIADQIANPNSTVSKQLNNSTQTRRKR